MRFFVLAKITQYAESTVALLTLERLEAKVNIFMLLEIALCSKSGRALIATKFFNPEMHFFM